MKLLLLALLALLALRLLALLLIVAAFARPFFRGGGVAAHFDAGFF